MYCVEHILSVAAMYYEFSVT